MLWFSNKPGSRHKDDVQFEVRPLDEETVLVLVEYE